MKRYFLLIFFGYIAFNIIYKSYLYIKSERVLGIVTEINRFKKLNNEFPVVNYTYKNTPYSDSHSEWGYINLLNVGDEVTVLIDENDQNNVSINTLFQFWFTLFDMFVVFLLCLIGTIILESLFPTKEKTPKIWK
jgi:hypothetical protein